jgi:thioredoxin reductase
MRRLIVIGAGPIGIEAALLGIERGFDVLVLEKERPGSSLRRWGATRFFSPFAMNVSARLRALLGNEAPAPHALLTGSDFVEQVIAKLVSRPPLLGKVLEKHAVVAVGRTRMTRKDMPNHPIRKERSFTIVAESRAGEKRFEADVVLDASGSQLPTYVGAGGLPAAGERRASDRIVRHLGELSRERIANKSVLVIGHGHSAANAIELAARVAEEHPGTSITWATRSMSKKPCIAVADDPLPERRRIVDAANALALRPPPFLTVERKAHVEAIEERGERLRVGLSGDREVVADVLCGFTGYRPDLSFLSEISAGISRVTEGAAGIDAKLSNVTDCLNVPRLTGKDLESGEPGFHLIGHKSYGRSSTFLLKDGLLQLETILESLS